MRQAQKKAQAPSAPFLLDGGNVGVLLIHGLSGAPEEMRPLGDHLWRRGYTVHGMLVAGHAGGAEPLRRSTWTDWYESAEHGLALLRSRCEHVVVVGFSMGAMLATRLAIRAGPVAGLVAMAPALWLRVPALEIAGALRHVVHDVPRLRSWSGARHLGGLRLFTQGLPMAAVHELSRLQRTVRSDLAQVRAPLLVFQGKRDRLVSRRGAVAQFRAARSDNKELIWLERSGHVLPLERDQGALFEHTARFIAQVSPAGPR